MPFAISILSLMWRKKVFLGKAVGKQGISFAVPKSLYQLAKGEYYLLVKEEIAEKKLVTDGKNNFQRSFLSKQFLWKSQILTMT